jgi:magnesium-transporting ATPase (P-type)
MKPSAKLHIFFSNKTGTLTMAKMVVVWFWQPKEGFFYVPPNCLAPKGDAYRTFDEMSDKPTGLEKSHLLNSLSTDTNLLVECTTLCHMSSINKRGPSIKDAAGHHTAIVEEKRLQMLLLLIKNLLLLLIILVQQDLSHHIWSSLAWHLRRMMLI